MNGRPPARLAELLLARDGKPDVKCATFDDAIEGEVELLWLTVWRHARQQPRTENVEYASMRFLMPPHPNESFMAECQSSPVAINLATACRQS